MGLAFVCYRHRGAEAVAGWVDVDVGGRLQVIMSSSFDVGVPFDLGSLQLMSRFFPTKIPGFVEIGHNPEEEKNLNYPWRVRQPGDTGLKSSEAGLIAEKNPADDDEAGPYRRNHANGENGEGVCAPPATTQNETGVHDGPMSGDKKRHCCQGSSLMQPLLHGYLRECGHDESLGITIQELNG
jgi:hypothetical protein